MIKERMLSNEEKEALKFAIDLHDEVMLLNKYLLNYYEDESNEWKIDKYFTHFINLLHAEKLIKNIENYKENK